MNGLRWRTLIIWLALLGGWSVPTYAQNQNRPAIDAEQLQDRLDRETIARLTQIARRAQQNGVPPQLIRQKVNEGVSKGVRGGRLVRAIEDYSRRLVQARNLLGRGARPAVLDAAAQAAEHGIPASRIRSFVAENRNPRRAVVGLRTIGELRDAGVPTDPAVRAVQAALDRGMSGERLLALSAAVRRRLRQGESPTDALRAITGGSRSGIRRAPTRDRPRDRGGSDSPRTPPRDRGGRDRG
ncbi:MAG: hypothetical protein ACE5FP_03925 [Gemmatimonadota bacterium]